MSAYEMIKEAAKKVKKHRALRSAASGAASFLGGYGSMKGAGKLIGKTRMAGKGIVKKLVRGGVKGSAAGLGAVTAGYATHKGLKRLVMGKQK